MWTDFTNTKPHAKLTMAEKLSAVFSHRRGDPFEAFELAYGLLDTCPGLVELSWKEATAVLGGLPAGDDRRDAACARRLAIGAAVIAFVSHRQARPDVRPDVE